MAIDALLVSSPPFCKINFETSPFSVDFRVFEKTKNIVRFGRTCPRTYQRPEQ